MQPNFRSSNNASEAVSTLNGFSFNFNAKQRQRGPRVTDADDILIGTDSADTLDGLGGDDIIDGLGEQDTLTGGDGRDRIAFSGDPFKGENVSAAGRQAVNLPDELTDFSISDDQFVLDPSDLGLQSPLNFVNGTADELAAADTTDANAVVIQGAFANAGVAASAIAESGVADSTGVFIYFNKIYRLTV